MDRTETHSNAHTPQMAVIHAQCAVFVCLFPLLCLDVCCCCCFVCLGFRAGDVLSRISLKIAQRGSIQYKQFRIGIAWIQPCTWGQHTQHTTHAAHHRHAHQHVPAWVASHVQSPWRCPHVLACVLCCFCFCFFCVFVFVVVVGTSYVDETFKPVLATVYGPVTIQPTQLVPGEWASFPLDATQTLAPTTPWDGQAHLVTQSTTKHKARSSSHARVRVRVRVRVAVRRVVC